VSRRLADAEVVISQPFWPAHLTAERIEKAPHLKLALTAGIGSDHVDLDDAIAHGVTVAEVTFDGADVHAAQEMAPHCDVITINAPLHPETQGLFGDDLLATMRRGAYLINTARALIVDRDPSSAHWRTGSSPATQVTFGTPSPPRWTTRGRPCRTTA
jgi:lactate dehydrogenase-like 2-hydroxyacid dehydrogenase